MRKKIYGITVATPQNPKKIVPSGIVKTVNGNKPDENGNVQVGGDWVTQEELSTLEKRMNEIHTDLSEATGRVEEQMSDVARDVGDLVNDVGDLANEVGYKYTKPNDGIPTSDLAEQTKADLVDAVMAALPVWEGGSY